MGTGVTVPITKSTLTEDASATTATGWMARIVLNAIARTYGMASRVLVNSRHALMAANGPVTLAHLIGPSTTVETVSTLMGSSVRMLSSRSFARLAMCGISMLA